MRYSLSTKITVIFAIGFSVICILFSMFAKLQHESMLDKVKENQYNAINWLLALYKKSNMPEDWEEYFKNFNLSYVTDLNLKKDILANGDLIERADTPLGRVETIFYDNDLFLKIKNQSVTIILQNTLKSGNDSLIIGFLLTIALFISLYISIFRSLTPLKQLRKDIRKFAAGNMDSICCKNIVKGDDEVAEVAYEFNNAACKIKELIMSRQLFLRTIMHELKTPIGKGRIVSEMCEDETQKNRLITIFERLNILINEFAKIEQLLSKSYSLQYEKYHFSLILDQTKDILLLDNFDKYVTLTLKSDPVLRVDFQLFSLAIKNLIDNALKYSDDKHAFIICDDDGIQIKNRGQKLEKSIEYYKQAFIRDTSSKNSGMGLGLYIIEHICDMHKFNLEYKYEDGYHIFCIKFKKIEDAKTKA
ncbi:HAMP domain-containing histidine kinase [Campylobacter hyointestinalis subsp. hyointestinalis]|uniref:ArsS family sensor histidine kinase n=1 Tax=Campylobacter hyointestinalis TaxID=198 RepID=UPI00072B0FD7|nr:ArsS family sensor histidine kinase [Campylobacter hyointestinalis]PPB57056.1 sensor histidine kinase [Campylobacter hyointestinalis subsp. hyointestinalis]PPB67633.1 sensor histidine kinase [Campylobacter hyointestinalis subsp. hyointestinalis]PPB69595.1 sensor histidine kinase [Campylobacter hyointestinalis subsp. hyointestinalis]QCT99697.1 HAMP domain-containing histidine kinase [Campylobacter hyointestinalis subsp. hyointestinalis]TWO18716.1 HAMP domain-containing histidine kinase [Camp